MSDREKLIELIGRVQDCGCDVTDVVKMNYIENTTLADHLISNGVTVQRWIPVSERLPEKEGTYITTTNATGRSQGVLVQEYVYRNGVGKWRWHDRYSPWTVTHWMPLPEPPKECE